MLLQVTRMAAFEASHFYQLAHLSDEENAARFGLASRHHGHNYLLHVGLTGALSPTTGWIINTQDIDRLLRETVIKELDHTCINLDHPYFHTRLPTTENLALYIWDRLLAVFPESVQLCQIQVCESNRLAAAFRGERSLSGTQEVSTVYFTRAYEFTASHRLFNPALSDEENRALFGKCFSPNGHGHNYRLEVTLAGEITPEQGMVTDLAKLDNCVQQEVLQTLDYAYLNRDVPEFKTQVPTTEHLVKFVWDRLSPHFAASPRLHRVRLYETPRSWFDYGLE